MIRYLEGSILKKEDDRILLLVKQIGYEVLLPAVVMETLAHKSTGDTITLYIYHQQTERQPKPILIGFNLEAEREFFQYFISVEDIGVLKAVKALDIPVRDISRAIEARDVGKLKQLKGIGERTAQKIIATLAGKMEKFALICKSDDREVPTQKDFSQQVMDVLVNQLGHKSADARLMITAAFKRNGNITTPEALFDEVYRGEVAS